MSKRCPDCGFVNEDSRIYCSSCGGLLSSDLRLIQDLEKQKGAPSKNASTKNISSQEQPARRQNKSDDDDYVPPKKAAQEESKSSAWVILLLVAAAAVVAFFLLK